MGAEFALLQMLPCLLLTAHKYACPVPSIPTVAALQLWENQASLEECAVTGARASPGTRSALFSSSAAGSESLRLYQAPDAADPLPTL